MRTSWHVNELLSLKASAILFFLPAIDLMISSGTPCPDFGGGEGESKHVGRWGTEDVTKIADATALRAFGLQEWDSTESGLTPGQREVMDKANKALGFYA